MNACQARLFAKPCVKWLKEERFKKVLYTIVYTYHELCWPVQFDFSLDCTSQNNDRVYPSDEHDEKYPGIQKAEDIGSSDFCPEVIPQIRKILTLDHDDHNGSRYGRRITGVSDWGHRVFCNVQWNHPSQDASAAVFLLENWSLSCDLMQNASEYFAEYYARNVQVP